MNKPRIRKKIFLTMAIIVAIPVAILSFMLVILSARNEELRLLDRFRYAQSYLSVLIQDRNRLVTARTSLVSEDPRLFAALDDPSTMHQKILLLMAEYGLDGYMLSSADETGTIQLLDQSLGHTTQVIPAQANPVISSSAILFFHSEILEAGSYQLYGIGSIKRSELEVLRAGTGAEVDIIHRNDTLGTRIFTTNKDAFGRNLAGTSIEPPLDADTEPDLFPSHKQPLGQERRYRTSTGQERAARLMALPPLMGTDYTASISIPHDGRAIPEVAAYLIASTFITLILATLASHLLARQLVDPIQTLLHGIENLSITIDAKGDFQPLPLPSRDEIGELTEAYNRMGVQLQSAYTSLTSQNEALKELDSIKDQFLATISRELRAPLDTIITLADSMAAVAAPHSIENKNLHSIANTGRKLYGMVNDILDHTRLEHSDIILSARTFELKPLVDTVLRFCSSIKRPEIELLNLVEPGRLVHGDEARLEQVMYNLVGRSIRLAENGTITVRSWEEESVLHVSVTRSGGTAGLQDKSPKNDFLSRTIVAAHPDLPDHDPDLAARIVRLHGGELEIMEDKGGTAIIRLSAHIPAATGQVPDGLLPP